MASCACSGSKELPGEVAKPPWCFPAGAVHRPLGSLASYCLQETKVLLEKAENGGSRVGLLRFIAAFSIQMSPRGLDIDVRHILVLVLLVGRLDDPDCMLRCSAAQLLISENPLLAATLY